MVVSAGTFLYDSAQEREFYGVSSKTQSYWTYANSAKHKPKFMNRFYQPFSSIKEVSPDSRSIKFWEGFYNPWIRSSLSQMHPDVTQPTAEIDTLRIELDEYVFFLFIIFENFFEYFFSKNDRMMALASTLREQINSKKGPSSSTDAVRYDTEDPLGANLLS